MQADRETNADKQQPPDTHAMHSSRAGRSLQRLDLLCCCSSASSANGRPCRAYLHSLSIFVFIAIAIAAANANSIAIAGASAIVCATSTQVEGLLHSRQVGKSTAPSSVVLILGQVQKFARLFIYLGGASCGSSAAVGPALPPARATNKSLIRPLSRLIRQTAGLLGGQITAAYVLFHSFH